MDLVGIAQKENPVVIPEGFKQTDPVRGNLQQHGIPCFVDVGISDPNGEEFSQALTKLPGSDPPPFEHRENAFPACKGIRRIKILHPQFPEPALGEVHIEITNNPAEIENDVCNCFRVPDARCRMELQRILF